MKKLNSISAILVFSFILLIPVLSQPLNDITSPSVQVVYAAGEDGIFMKSSNAGTSYTSTLITSGDLKGIGSGTAGMGSGRLRQVPIKHRSWCLMDLGILGAGAQILIQFSFLILLRDIYQVTEV